MTNSWAFEINHRSPVYLADIDKLYLAVAYGTGSNENNLTRLQGRAAGRYGYYFYRDLGFNISDVRLSAYSSFSRSTFGSVWITYGKDRNKKNKEEFLVSIPSRLDFKVAFAWKFMDNVTAAVSGSMNNYPPSYIFALQPTNSSPADTQFSLSAGDGENIVGEVDLLYRTRTNLDVILGGVFQASRTKYDAPGPPYDDTATVKEYIYSGAPRFSIKKTFATGSYLRAGAAYYFNLFDYVDEKGGNPWESPSQDYASYRLQRFDSFVPLWKVFTDGSKALGTNATLYSRLEAASYPNALTKTQTDFVPVNLSLIDSDNLFSGCFAAEIAGRLTRIISAAVGIELRYVDIGVSKSQLDDRSLYAKLRLGATTRFYRNLWWSVRIPDLRLYTSKEVGSAALFENRSYIETEILFLGL
jgi:hypothetical protein